MSIFFLKSVLSLVLLFSALISMFTMFEIFGKAERKFSIEKLKKIHKINSYIYLVTFLFITYFCLNFIVSSKIELSPRSAFHTVFAIAAAAFFGIKVAILKSYRQFYNQAKIFGLLISITTFGMVGVSGGYYLLVTKFGTDAAFDKVLYERMKGRSQGVERIEQKKFAIKTDTESIGKGKDLFDSKCSVCHNAYSAETKVGPGFSGVLRRSNLPVSKKPATPENIANQLRNPYKNMPPFPYLSDDDIQNIIAFLNTL